MQQGRELPSQQKNACVLLGETGTIRGGGPSCGAPGGSGEWTLGRGTAELEIWAQHTHPPPPHTHTFSLSLKETGAHRAVFSERLYHPGLSSGLLSVLPSLTCSVTQGRTLPSLGLSVPFGTPGAELQGPLRAWGSLGGCVMARDSGVRVRWPFSDVHPQVSHLHSPGSGLAMAMMVTMRMVVMWSHGAAVQMEVLV